ncbi:hypothetical protein CN540_16855 [Bacillus toyonensis]|uniref:hypothetical protein n=1 Tax=Bacillus toyonensis TaxID=155322 RepID=UPI000BF224EE|nr:hypothetical protein [Bacillus toyonensis]PEN54690.1 hypothetical protein CN540_16855 [Bacillus toyonensis]PGE06647.1 hypothetical protein COM54_27650 [Bacillus toyonensis]PGE12883.1 hypothetical protein COM64_25825 [Bacillus toyonensis]
MLEVELDIFSGRPNPKWVLSEEEEKELLNIILSDPTEISPVYTSEVQFGLGYRGLIVREIKSDEGIWNKANRALDNPLPNEFRVGSKASKQAAAELLLKTCKKQSSVVSEELLEWASEGVVLLPTPNKTIETTDDDEISRAVRWETCHSNYFSGRDHHVFNHLYNVRHSNCYAYAANNPGAGRYTLPGLQGGRPILNPSRSEMNGALFVDGWNHHSCWPSAQNVLIIAAVIKPSEPWDFHFYRCTQNGPDWEWGHKPGATMATDLDNSRGRISNPETCNRGPYTDFCGYFYHNGPTVTVKCNNQCYP